MIFDLPKDIVTQAEEFWNKESFPLLRYPRPGERTLILGMSVGQGKPVLLSRELNGKEDYGISACEATNILPINMPERFNCSGEAVARISDGFYDGYGDWFSEITFDKSWHVTLLQFWLDAENIPICIRKSKDAKEDKLICDHVELSSYSFGRSIDKTMKLAVMGNYYSHISIQNEIKKYVADYWRNKHILPSGTHTINGIQVKFDDQKNIF